MKFINSFCSNILVLLLVITCSNLVIASDRKVKVYTVEINDIPFCNDIAEIIILHITNGGRNSIKAYDNRQNTDILLSHVAENMNVSIRDNELLSGVSDLYKNLFENKNADYKHSKMGDMSCISGNVELDKKPTKLHMCIDNNKQVSRFVM